MTAPALERPITEEALTHQPDAGQGPLDGALDPGVQDDGVLRGLYAGQIRQLYQKTVENIISMGNLLIQAKADLVLGDFEAMVEQDLGWSPRTSQRLMAIAAHPILANPTHVSLLPAHWGTLYALARLPQPILERALAQGKISPETERHEVSALKSAERLRALQRVDAPCQLGPGLTDDRTRQVRRLKPGVWTIRVVPNPPGVELRRLVDEAWTRPLYAERRAQAEEMRAEAETLRQRANEIEREARELIHSTERAIGRDLRVEHGPIHHYTQTRTFWLKSEGLDHGLEAAESDDEREALLHSALEQGEAGYSLGTWGDLTLSCVAAEASRAADPRG